MSIEYKMDIHLIIIQTIISYNLIFNLITDSSNINITSIFISNLINCSLILFIEKFTEIHNILSNYILNYKAFI